MDHGHLQAVVDALPYPAFFVAEDYIISHANVSATQTLEQNLVGQVFARVIRQPVALDCLKTAFQSQTLQSCDVVLNIPSPRTFQASASQVGSHLLFTFLDVSAELDAEKARSTFVANVSHELRSPLTALAGIVETLQGPARYDEAARDRFLDLMQGETERMSRLVGDLLSLSKLEAKEHLTPLDPVNLNQTLKRVITVLSESMPSYKDRVKLTAPEDDILVTGDGDDLTKVFQNLIENALKYSSADSDVLVDLSRGGAQTQKATVTIKDFGDGIAANHLPRLTERFYRVDKGRSREVGGTGLGLAIVKHVLNRHRARLSFESQLSEGTEVSVAFNAAPPHPSDHTT